MRNRLLQTDEQRPRWVHAHPYDSQPFSFGGRTGLGSFAERAWKSIISGWEP